MLYIGIDLGGTNIAAGIVDETGRLVRKTVIPTLRERPYQEIIKDMALLALRIIKDSGVDETEVAAIGLGSPGIPDSEAGIVIYNSNLNFRRVPVRAEIQKYINLPVFLDNDANCAALAESVAGAAKGSRDSVTITLGTGVGAGIIVNKKVYSGFNYAASEIGHTVIAMDGELCLCGRRGCWEVYASLMALIQQTQTAARQNPASLLNRLIDDDLSKINIQTPFEAAKAGDETGRRVVNQYLRYISIGLINIINSIQPEILVIGGGISKIGDDILVPLKELVGRETLCLDIPQPQIKIAQMGNDAGIIGAAMLCR